MMFQAKVLSPNHNPALPKKFTLQPATRLATRCSCPFLKCAISAIALLVAGISTVAQALPPPEDIPEEILRTEIILEARSDVDGQPLSTANYDQLRETLAMPHPRTLPPEIQDLIFLLQLRRVIKPVFPLIP